MTLVELVGTLGLSDREVLAATLWAEARSEAVVGRIAVGCVIRNRMIRRHQTVKHVCLAKLQFSCWFPQGGEANHLRLRSLVENIATFRDPLWGECLWIADGILSGACLDITRGADHYLTTTLLASDKRPSWVEAMACAGVHGSHTFYRSEDRKV